MSEKRKKCFSFQIIRFNLQLQVKTYAVIYSYRETFSPEYPHISKEKGYNFAQNSILL